MVEDAVVNEQERVPAETYIPDGQLEEERIMRERAAKPRAFDSTTLRVPVEGVIDVAKPIAVQASTNLRETVEAMRKGRTGAVLVVDAAKRLLGIFTERDVIMKVAGKGLDWSKETVGAYMTPNPETLPDDANLAFALNMMTMGGYRHVPIVDDEKRPVGLVSMSDVVRYIAGFFAEEVQNLPPRPNLVHPEKREDG